MPSDDESSGAMTLPVGIAHLIAQPGLDALRVGFVVTILALAVIVRQPAKSDRKKDDK